MKTQSWTNTSSCLSQNQVPRGKLKTIRLLYNGINPLWGIFWSLFFVLFKMKWRLCCLYWTTKKMFHWFYHFATVFQTSRLFCFVVKKILKTMSTLLWLLAALFQQDKQKIFGLPFYLFRIHLRPWSRKKWCTSKINWTFLQFSACHFCLQITHLHPRIVKNMFFQVVSIVCKRGVASQILLQKHLNFRFWAVLCKYNEV